VNQSVAVGLGQRLAHLPEDINDPRGGKGPVLLDQRLQVAPFEQFHDVVEGAVVGGAEVIYADGVGRLQRRGRLGFALETAEQCFGAPICLRTQRLRTDQLDGRRSAEHPVPGSPNLAHAART